MIFSAYATEESKPYSSVLMNRAKITSRDTAFCVSRMNLGHTLSLSIELQESLSM